VCGRFSLATLPNTLARQFGVADVPTLPARYNIAPSQDIAAVRQGTGGRECTLLHWGLVPAWSKEPKTRYSTINARAETVAAKPAYRDAFRHRRCLIPATGFYEWQQQGDTRVPYYICMQDGGLFAFAGLWEHWQQGDRTLDSCTIIVTTANRLMAPIHARMPVILAPPQYADWLDPGNTNREHLQSLLAPWTATPMEAWPVSRLVNNPRHDSARCMARAGDE
jgi:putative SOS response-associated peptidase YedK